MLWKFSFTSGASLESLFTRETPPSVEEVMDEKDVLNECKGQNQRLVSFLGREDTIKSLLQWIVSGLDELNEQIAQAEEAALQKALSDPEQYPSYQSELLLSAIDSKAGTSTATDMSESPPMEPAKMAEEAMRRAESERDFMSASYERGNGNNGGSGNGNGNSEETPDEQRSRYPHVAAEILTSELWIVPETIMSFKETLLRPFWDAVIPMLDRDKATIGVDLGTLVQDASTDDPEVLARRRRELFKQTEMQRARQEFWSEEDEERERKREVIKGLWSKVIVSLITKRTTEMIRFIQSIPDAVPRICTQITSPAIQDILLRLVGAEEGGVVGTVQWLSERELTPRLISYLSPLYPSSTHVVVGELLKSIITLCAPTPFNPHGGNLQEQQAGDVHARPARDNRLIRELISQDVASVLVGYMLDPLELSDADWKGINNDGTSHPADAFIVHPVPNVASATTSVSYIANIFVEIIRRNNSDFAEPHLFHTLRNRLMNMRMAEGSGITGVARSDDGSGSVDNEESRKEQQGRERMEGAMKEISETMGIVHLGSLLRLLSERFERVYELLQHPRAQIRASSSATPHPLTEERFRLIELFAELLHSSNMAILNRNDGTGPTYSSEGILSGGLSALEALGEAIAAEGEGEDGQANATVEEPLDDMMTPARELPVSCGSTDVSAASLSDSDVEMESEDEREIEAIDEADADVTPSQSRRASRIEPMQEAEIPPLSRADEERLVSVRDSSPPVLAPEAASVASNAAVANSTAAPSEASEDAMDVDEKPDVKPAASEAPPLPSRKSTLTSPLEERLAPGRMLKQAYKTHGVIPLVVDMFFSFTDNNFLHHVVYDLLQQIMNGRLGPGQNRELVVEIMVRANLAERVLKMVVYNDHIVTQDKRPRLGLMGHIVLVSDEIVKLLARAPPDLLAIIQPHIPQPAWDEYVAGQLQESKMRDALPLAGGKPAIIPTASGTAAGVTPDTYKSPDDSSDSSDEEDDDETERRLSSFGSFGEPLQRTRAAEGFIHRGGGEEGDEEEDDRVRSYYWRSGPNERRHIDSSDEDEDDADWLKPGNDFGNFQNYQVETHGDDSDDEEGWGTFSSASASHNETVDDGSGNPFGDDNFSPFNDGFTPSVQTATARQAQAARGGQGQGEDGKDEHGMPLTPLDWFQREFNKAWGDDGEGEEGNEEQEEEDVTRGTGEGGHPTIVVPDLEEESGTMQSTQSTQRSSKGKSKGKGKGEDVDTSADADVEDADLELELPNTPGSAWSFEGDEGDGVDLPAAFSSTVGGRGGSGVSDQLQGLGLGEVTEDQDGETETERATTTAPIPITTTHTLAKPIDIPISPSRAGRTSAAGVSTSPINSPSSPSSASPRRAPPPPPPSRRRAGSVTSAPVGGVPAAGPGSSAASPAREAFSPRHQSGRSGGSGSFGSFGSSAIAGAASGSGSGGMAFSPPDSAVLAAASPAEPLGPGVSADTTVTDGGMLKREVEGEEVVVPKDEVVLGVESEGG